MKKLVFIGVVLAAVYFSGVERWLIPGQHDVAVDAQGGDQVFAAAFENRRRDVQVEGRGQVIRILPDDNSGSRHQRFIVRLASGQTLLVAHNIDLAKRVAAVKTGDPVEFYGEYEWTAQGGVIHWTHRDPRHSHVDGWIKHEGHTYQ